MKTSIIILTYNKLYYTKICIDSIRKYTNKDMYEIIVVDNNSSDGTVAWLQKQWDIKTILNKVNYGFPKGCNQGIKIAEGENILLLNNDVVVTPNWLENLLKCLYSLDDIGAVGPITNYCANHQSIKVKYKNLKEMNDFAKKFNVSNPLKWECRLKLIGFCFLIKKEVIEKVGLLDEIFTPGTYEDDDYSFRIRKNGYKLMLCKDTFIHHYGSISFKQNIRKFHNTACTNKHKFEVKWGCDSHRIGCIRKEITSIIKEAKRSKLNILHIGCGGGGTLLDIKNEIPEANLYGLENNIKAVVNTEYFAKIDIGGLEKLKNYDKNFFDYIIVDGSYNNVEKNLKGLFTTMEYLGDTGSFIVVLPKKSYTKMGLLEKQINKTFNDFTVKIVKCRGYRLLILKE